MDRFHEMLVYVAVAEEQGFAAAARRLQMSPPAVTRAVAALEERLGIRLLTRTTRSVRVTDAGERYLEDARRILAELESADEAAAGIDATPRGELTVTAPVMFGRLYVLPGILDYLHQYPETRVHAMFLDRVVNLLDEGIDVAVRIGQLPDSSLRATRVGSVRVVVCASPDYLSMFGTPETPQQLTNHQVINVAGGSGQVGWQFSDQSRAVQLKPRLTVTTNNAAVSAATQGFGITRLLSYQVASAISEGSLVPILENYEPDASPVQIVHREGRLQSAKLRAFVDLLSTRLRENPLLKI